MWSPDDDYRVIVATDRSDEAGKTLFLLNLICWMRYRATDKRGTGPPERTWRGIDAATVFSVSRILASSLDK
ncbi:MAG: hypothetical protein DME22_11935 [Verrucomicrobia bacterium]|nr:MAG: hypothetical protein DME22_11935 [Verrucomicrobiota bacterium]PYK00955.1 MAG: hypothetical protein DME23_05530 [Verrucomicrobiota bacterium]